MVISIFTTDQFGLFCVTLIYILWLIWLVVVFWSILVITFENITNKYYPVLYLNKYWNLASDYMPVNETTK